MSSASAAGAACGEERAAIGRRTAGAALSGIVLAALLLRLYRLDEQSLWWDDWNGLAHLAAPGFIESMLDARNANPEGAPLYHVVQYAAAFVFGTGEYGQRLFNVLLSVAAAPVVYAIGRRAAGRTAGLAAAACCALSPTLVFHAQSLRIYPLEVLLCALALWSCQRLIAGGGGRWTAANAVLNGLACLTHFFAAFGVIAQGAALLVQAARFRDRRRRFIAWCIVQLVALAPALAFLLLMPPRPPEAFWHFQRPGAAYLVSDLFGDDVVSMAYEGRPWAIALAGMSTDAPAVRQLAGAALMLLFAAGAAHGVWRWLRTMRPAAPPPAASGTAMLLVFYWLMPVVLLAVKSLVSQPLIYPRYTVYASLALYVMAGAALAALPGRKARAAAAAAGGLLLVYQLAFLLPVDTRTAWRRVAREIADETGPGDLVIATGGVPGSARRTLAYHFPVESETPIVEAPTAPAALALARSRLAAGPAARSGGAVWLVHNTHFGQMPRSTLERYLAANGIRYKGAFHPPMEGLFAVRILDWPEAASDAPIVTAEPGAAQSFAGFDCREGLRRLGLPPDDAALRRALALVWDSPLEPGMGDDFKARVLLDAVLLEEWPLARAVAAANLDRAGALPDRIRSACLSMAEGQTQAAIDLIAPLLPAGAPLRAMLQPPAEMAAVLALLLHSSGQHAAAQRVYRAAAPVLAMRGWAYTEAAEAYLEGRQQALAAALKRERTRAIPFNEASRMLVLRAIGLGRDLAPCGAACRAVPVPGAAAAAFADQVERMAAGWPG